MNKLAILAVGGVMLFALAGCTAAVNQDSAQKALAAGRLDDAAANIQTALEHDPDNPQLKQLAAQIYTQRGVQYYRQGTMIAASDDFHRAVDYYPNYATAWDYLGMIASQQNDWQNAINYGDKAASLEGKPDPAYVEDARRRLAKVQNGGLPPRRRTNEPQRSPGY